jgi:glutaredoxin
MTVSVTLYTRANCHLCQEAAAALSVLATQLPIDVAPVDIDADPALRARFNDAVPVIAVEGTVVSSAPIDLEAVRLAIEARR